MTMSDVEDHRGARVFGVCVRSVFGACGVINFLFLSFPFLFLFFIFFLMLYHAVARAMDVERQHLQHLRLLREGNDQGS